MDKKINILEDEIQKCQDSVINLKEKIEKLRNTSSDIDNIKECKTIGQCKPNLVINLKERRILTGHFGKIYACNWCHTLSRTSLFDQIVSASQDGKLIVWNAFKNSKIIVIHLTFSWVLTTSFSPSGKMVTCGGLDNAITLYSAVPEFRKDRKKSLSDGTIPIREYPGHEGYISCVKWLDEEKFVSSSGDQTLRLWDVEKGETIRVFKGHAQDVMSVSANDYQTFFSGSVDSTARFWDIRSNECTRTFLGHESDINAVCAFPDTYALGTASDDSSCRLFDSRCWAQLHEYRDDNIICGLTSLCFSNSGRILFAGYDDFHIRLWDTVYGNEIDNKLLKHNNRIACLDIQSGNQALCSGSWDTSLKIWA